MDLQELSDLMLKLRSYTGNKQTSKDLGCIYLSTMSMNIFQILLCLKFLRKEFVVSF